jgi:putative tryptophan/tyrosine transport system substrate-binding protein
MRRREFITLLGGVVATLPLAAGAQQSERMRRIGILMGVADDAETKAWLVVLRQKIRTFLVNLRAQHGHLGSSLATATIKR